jgi:hypothetical protein
MALTNEETFIMGLFANKYKDGGIAQPNLQSEIDNGVCSGVISSKTAEQAIDSLINKKYIVATNDGAMSLLNPILRLTAEGRNLIGI